MEGKEGGQEGEWEGGREGGRTRGREKGKEDAREHDIWNGIKKIFLLVEEKTNTE